jgi:hypothetical protein
MRRFIVHRGERHGCSLCMRRCDRASGMGHHNHISHHIRSRCINIAYHIDHSVLLTLILIIHIQYHHHVTVNTICPPSSRTKTQIPISHLLLRNQGHASQNPNPNRNRRTHPCDGPRRKAKSFSTSLQSTKWISRRRSVLVIGIRLRMKCRRETRDRAEADTVS